MITITLAAGYATRMYPLTENFPKPLLTVKGETILNKLLGAVDGLPYIERHVVVTNHKFIGHFKSWRSGTALTKPVVLIDDGSTENGNRLGAVNDIVLALDSVGINDDVLVMAGDNVLTFPLSTITDAFMADRISRVFCYEEKSVEALSKTGVLVLDEHKNVLEMQEKPASPKSHWACPPFYVYAKSDLPRVLAAVAGGAETDAPGSLVKWICLHTQIRALEMPGRRIDVGSVAGYEAIK